MQEIRKSVAKCVCWFLALGAPAHAQNAEGIAGAGSPERRSLCDAIVELFVSGFEPLAEGTSFERVLKELEIALAGQEYEAELLKNGLIGAALSEKYANDNRSIDDLKIDGTSLEWVSEDSLRTKSSSTILISIACPRCTQELVAFDA